MALQEAHQVVGGDGAKALALGRKVPAVKIDPQQDLPEGVLGQGRDGGGSSHSCDEGGSRSWLQGYVVNEPGRHDGVTSLDMVNKSIDLQAILYGQSDQVFRKYR
ncbi:hypothetical protein Vretimale_2479 [Volvox reticuliferus]|nr:hypothetical protein Vretimale_2479 [Volvox reticuliferus]